MGVILILVSTLDVSRFAPGCQNTNTKQQPAQQTRKPTIAFILISAFEASRTLRNGHRFFISCPIDAMEDLDYTSKAQCFIGKYR